MSEYISPKDWVLAFLLSGNNNDVDKPVMQGWLMFTKQFFVFVKEVQKDLDIDFKYIPYDYGPYSYNLQKIVSELEKEGYIKLIKNEDRKDYYLTKKGIEYGNDVIKKIPDKTLNTMNNLRKEATQLGYAGILRYVYVKYPEYTSASKIKGDVINV